MEKIIKVKITKKIDRLAYTEKGYRRLGGHFMGDMANMLPSQFDKNMALWTRNCDRVNEALWKEIRKQLPRELRKLSMSLELTTGIITIKLPPDYNKALTEADGTSIKK